MASTISLDNLMGLDNQDFPEQLFLLYSPSTGLHACFCIDNNIHGLAAFSNHENAVSFAQYIDNVSLSTQEKTFDEARDIAKSKPLPIVALLLLDDLNDPKIHYVR